LRTFGNIESKYAGSAGKIWLQSIPYDGTSTWGKGADKGFEAFLHAAENMELYDIETASEVYKHGIHLLPEITENKNPEVVFNQVYQTVKELIASDKFLTFFGGEHSISIGIIKAFYETYENLTVLQLDAHADLRPTYNGSPFNHACALYDASQKTNLIQVGIRSMDISEKQYMDNEKVYFAHELSNDWMQESISQMSENVYLTLDLDVLDPSIMPATGTPEPGGMQWNETLTYLKEVFCSRNVVGFDIVELAPIEGWRAPDFLVAKLYYKMLSYKFHQNG
jgi:agmatinase